MSTDGPKARRITVPELAARKGGVPIVSLTAYTAPMARLLDPYADLILVGDSLGMVLYGLPSTLGVTLEMMILHGQAVMRGSARACVVVDLPFATYQQSPQQAFATAARVLAETGAAAVKLEGGEEMADTIRFLVRRGVPVLAHVGLTPQSVNTLGGYGARGKIRDEAERIVGDARAVAEAGAFAVVIENTVESVARQATEAVRIATIGIGASAACDGQVLVTDDMLGLSGQKIPRFARRYAELATDITRSVAAYADDVRARRFPGEAELTIQK